VDLGGATRGLHRDVVGAAIASTACSSTESSDSAVS
jgi:hypothetical protein